MQVGTVLDDGLAQRHRLNPGCTSRLGLLPGCVDLDVNVDLGGRGLGLDQLAPVLVQELRLFERVDARDAPEVGDLGQVFAVAWTVSFRSLSETVQHTRLQAADKVPLDGPGQHFCLLAQLLGIVLSKVELLSRCLVEGNDVVDRLQFRDGNKSDLMVLSECPAMSHQWH